MNSDKIKGMLYGVAVGDALGAPFELRGSPNIEQYTGLIYLPIKVNTRWQGLRVEPIGSTMDNFQMTLALARSIAKNKEYNRDKVILSYLDFAKDNKCMGKNTRKLFKGINTIKGYRNRYENMMTGVVSEGNGFIMRCSSIATLQSWIEVSDIDCCLTNPVPACVDASRVYLGSIRDAFNNKSPDEILIRAIDMAETKEVVEILEQVQKGEKRDVKGKTKGWYRHSLYCAYAALMLDKSFEESIDWVVRLQGDSDSNAAIAGALLGARYGFNRMNKEDITPENIKRVLVDHDEIDRLARALSGEVF
uniref:ADP-ribosylglycohydrolase n=1 Tax=Pithovirus LCPAC403 TaxID=2506596 RepID=A0A481ZDQ5_9VIRU|nr:MAG: ADP-ribosylglycohydrolase [Pithovirus LCPAC403]